MAQRSEHILGADQLGKLIEALVRKGYEVIGPTLRDGAIVYDNVESVEDLPAGWTDEQEPGRYRLKRREDEGPVRIRGGTTELEELPAPSGSATLVGRAPGWNVPNPEQ